MFNKQIIGLSIYALIAGISLCSVSGKIVTDYHNHWGHNDRLGDAGTQASYILCEGYLGSPLLPNNSAVLERYSNNCELTPPPGTIGIIDLPENHSTDYSGYPAYSIVSDSGQIYFVCDGFLSSTSWCSLAAERKAEQYRRALQPRNWELKSQSVTVTSSIERSQVTIEKTEESVNHTQENTESKQEKSPKSKLYQAIFKIVNQRIENNQ